MSGTLFVKEKEGNTVNDVLCRILTYAEIYLRNNNCYPDFVELSQNDLNRIKQYNKTLIDENDKILGMKIVTYKEKKNEFQRRKRQNDFQKR